MIPFAAMVALPTPLAFFGMGDTEVLLIMVVVLIFFGGQKMPDFARGLGKALRELRKASGEVEREFKRVIEEAEHPVTPPRPASAPLQPTVPASQPAWTTPGEAKAESAAGSDEQKTLPAKDESQVLPPPAPKAPPQESGAEYHSDI